MWALDHQSSKKSVASRLLFFLQLLQQRAQKRIGAEQALRHRYFSDLPPKIHELGDGEKFF
jgi:hypothetical protein